MNTELLWQFDLTWALADLHLAALVEDDFLWEPAPLAPEHAIYACIYIDSL
jgi:hypothetical protein